MSDPLHRTASVLAAMVLVVACAGDDTAEPSPSSSSTSVADTTPSTEATTSSSSSSTTTTPGTTSTSTFAPGSLPTNGRDYATAAIEAWMEGDETALERLMAVEARETLFAAPVDAVADWDFQQCEGAAGSVYCSWHSPDGTLTFRVGNQAAAGGEEQAVIEVGVEIQE